MATLATITTTQPTTVAWPLTGSTTLAGPCSLRMAEAKDGMAVVFRDSQKEDSRDSSVDLTVQASQGGGEEQASNDQRKQGKETEGEEWSEFEEGLDLLAYSPPEAVMRVPENAPEIIATIVETALENVTQQLRIEKRRQEDAATRPDEHDHSKGKGKFNAEPPGLPSIRVTSTMGSNQGSETASTAPDDSSVKSPGRSRFGLRHMIHHLKGETKGETSAAGATGAFGESDSASSGDVTEVPSSFTQFIYKHMLLKATPSAAQGSDEVTCVSCFEDLKPKDMIKTVCHTYCKTCFNLLIETAISNAVQWPPKCCLNPVPYRIITKHLPPPLLKRYKQKHAELVTPATQRIYCPTPDCGLWIAPHRVHKFRHTARCSEGHTTCTRCQLPISSSSAPPSPTHCTCPRPTATLHVFNPSSFTSKAKNTSSSASTPDDLTLADTLATTLGWRRCPTCGILIEHASACQHMTCTLCAAQFCYVCGKVWRTCRCTTRQLDQIKAKAEAKQLELMQKEEEEMRRRQEEREKERRVREEEERVREEEWAAEMAKREMAKREEERKGEVRRRFGKLRGKWLGEVEGLQRRELKGGREEETGALERRREALRGKTMREQEVEMRRLKAVLEEQVERRREELEKEYRVRVAWEKKVEGEYQTALSMFWAGKPQGIQRAEQALRAFLGKNDERMERWCKWRDQELGKAQYTADEELAVRGELMEALRKRQDDMFEEEERELKRKHAAERRWFVLVAAERRRLLDEAQMIELENGGDMDAENLTRMMDEALLQDMME